MRVLDWLHRFVARQTEMHERLQKIQIALGRIESRQTLVGWNGELSTAEFQVFSQWAEDGIIHALTSTVRLPNKIFVEFGVQSYVESNTRFLLMQNNWSGLVIDGDQANVGRIKSDDIYWRHNIKAEYEFVTAENINGILTKNGLSGEIGLLSIDIDGNDYWVWQAITAVSPAIVIVEYNSRFGSDRAVTIPYEPQFTRERAHHSLIYYGASLAALCHLGNLKGYAFVGSNSAGNNAFFVRRDLLKEPLREKSVAEGYVRNAFREGRDENGELAYYSADQEELILRQLPLVDVMADPTPGLPT